MKLFSDNKPVPTTKSRVIKQFILKDGARRTVIDKFRLEKSKSDFVFDQVLYESIGDKVKDDALREQDFVEKISTHVENA